jgi:hypothetical protein
MICIIDSKKIQDSKLSVTIIRFFFSCSADRRYTKFYGTSPRSAVNLVQDALMSMFPVNIHCTTYVFVPNLWYKFNV